MAKYFIDHVGEMLLLIHITQFRILFWERKMHVVKSASVDSERFSR